MRNVIWAFVAVVVLYAVYASITFYQGVQASKKLAAATVSYTKDSSDHTVPVLVLGDSTAVGVGAARPEESLAGLIADALHATSVENYAKSGAVVADLPGQVKRATLSHYRLILIQIGGNDIIAFHSASSSAALLATILPALPKADKVIVISAGDVGGASLFPFFIRPYYTRLNLAYHAAFAQVVTAAGMTYVNLYQDPGAKLISGNPNYYLKDGLHPSSAGYALWFEAIQPQL